MSKIEFTQILSQLYILHNVNLAIGISIVYSFQSHAISIPTKSKVEALTITFYLILLKEHISITQQKQQKKNAR